MTTILTTRSEEVSEDKMFPDVAFTAMDLS